MSDSPAYPFASLAIPDTRGIFPLQVAKAHWVVFLLIKHTFHARLIHTRFFDIESLRAPHLPFPYGLYATTVFGKQPTAGPADACVREGFTLKT